MVLAATASVAIAAPAAASSPRFVIAGGRISAGGLQGEWREVGDLANGRFAIRADLGTYRTADIYDGHARWRVDPSGANHPLDSASARRSAVTEAWLARFIWTGQQLRRLPHSRPKSEIADGRRYSTLTVAPEGGEPIKLWFDIASGRVVRAARWLWFFDYSTTYGDYRQVDRHLLPFAIVNSGAGMTESINVVQYSFSDGAPPGSFVRPAQPRDASVPLSGTVVPVAVFPQLTLRALVNGRSMDFLFDTGGHSVLTVDAAKSLGLKMIGSQQSGGSGAGTLLQQETRGC